MKRLLLIACCSSLLALSGCGWFSQDQAKGPDYPVVGVVDQTKMEQAAFAARSGYAAVLRVMAEYVKMPRCTATQKAPCSDQGVVNEMRKVELAADTATKGAADLARSPTKTPVALANAVNDAQRALAVFRASVGAYNSAAITAQ